MFSHNKINFSQEQKTIRVQEYYLTVVKPLTHNILNPYLQIDHQISYQNKMELLLLKIFKIKKKENDDSIIP